MKIALVGTIDSPIRKDSLGGTEMWTYNLAEELIQAGHTVQLFAAKGSLFSGKTLEISDREYFFNESGDISWPRYSLENVEQVLEVLKREQEFDIIHFCSFPFYYSLPLSDLFSKPTIFTIHGYNDFDLEHAKYFISKYKKTHFVYVSKSFMDNWPKSENTHLIRNGIKVDDFDFSDQAGDYVFWMGRLSQDKNISQVIEFGQKSKDKLIIAGPIRNRNIFENEVKPFLGEKITYVGELGYEEKIQYYQKAKAFLFPIKIKEPLPLVVLEALSCGTPILSFDVDPMRELVIEGKTGYIAEPGNINQLVQMSNELGNIVRKDCREFVENNFNLKIMAEAYMSLYDEVLSQ